MIVANAVHHAPKVAVRVENSIQKKKTAKIAPVAPQPAKKSSVVATKKVTPVVAKPVVTKAIKAAKKPEKSSKKSDNKKTSNDYWVSVLRQMMVLGFLEKDIENAVNFTQNKLEKNNLYPDFEPRARRTSFRHLVPIDDQRRS